MNRKGPWEGYSISSKERRLGTRQMQDAKFKMQKASANGCKSGHWQARVEHCALAGKSLVPRPSAFLDFQSDCTAEEVSLPAG